MKKIIFCFVIMVLFLSGTVTLIAQNIQPDETFVSEVEDLVWYPNGTAFTTFNGITYMFVWTREEPVCSWGYYNWYPYVYEFVNGDFQPFMVKNSQKLEFHYRYEDGEWYAVPYRKKVTIVGNAVAFSYYGQLWFTCLIEHPPYFNYYPGDLYYQLWARYDNDMEGWVTWYDSIPEKPVHWMTGACQVDSLVRICSWYDDISQLVAEDYMLNSITKKLDKIGQFEIPVSGNYLRGMIPYEDTLNKQCVLYLVDDNTINLGASVVNNNSLPFIYGGWTMHSSFTSGASTICEGSVQGMRTTVSGIPALSRRFNLFYINPNKNSDGTYSLQNIEFAILDDPTQGPQEISSCKVNLPATNCLQKIDGEFQIGSSYSLIPENYLAEVPGLDGLKQQIQVFYPDKNGRIYGAFFNSDIWRPVQYSSIQSTDLKNDSIYGPEVRKLWTLIGITDGAPPCAIDWPVWETWHFAEDATTFGFKIGQSSNSEISSSYEDAYSVGYKIETGFEKISKAENSFKYSNSYKSTVKSSTEVKVELAKEFALNKASQEFAYYIWMIPDITRTSYNVYPWYDKTWIYPISNSLQYQFRTESFMLKTENVEASDFPFLIDEPNDPQMLPWTEDSRFTMVNSAFYAGVKPLLSLSYTSPNPGDAFTFEGINTTVSSVETNNTYQTGGSVTLAVPAVFKISGQYDVEASYSSEITFETKVGTEVEVSLAPLTDAEEFGIYNPEYDVDLYWFRPNVSPWWYLDSLDGQKPWYFGYVASTDRTKIIPQSPVNESRLKSLSELVFNWTTENGEVSDFVLFISTETLTGPGSTVYQLSCVNRKVASPVDFEPEPGRTYYWSVRGLTKEGHVKWSRSMAFTVGEAENKNELTVKAEVYPNPVQNGQFYATYELPEAGNVMISIYDISGQMIQQSDPVNRPSGVTTETMELKGFVPGLYLVVIHTDLGIVTKKLMVR